MNTLPRRDGHTHTEFCPHGSGELTELFIKRAIELGFFSYSLTEHPPLPPGFEDPAPTKDCFIAANDLEAYFRLARQLKQKFAGQIDLRIGLEVDYVPGYEGWIRDLLGRYGADLDDALLSIHFMQGRGGWRCVDHSPNDFREGLLEVYGSAEAVHHAYWKMVKDALSADLGPYKPRRMGHLSLVHKFQRQFPLSHQEYFRPQIEEILDIIKAKEMELDLDAAGIFKPDCQEVYPAPWIIKEAIRREIPLVYGSDAHSVKGVGQGFDEAQYLVESLISGSR
jgi:histidinol-phosphatase (PHP family)